MIEIDNVYKSFGDLEVIKGISLTVNKGEVVSIIGATGSGKSTLITHMNGLNKPTSGKIIIDGRDLWAEPEKIRDFRFLTGLVFQYPEYQLFEETCYKDIAFGPKNMGLDEAEIDRRVHEAADFVGLDEALLQRSPFELSGGQKRRVAVAGVMAMKPRILVLDEPAAGLDPEGRDEILSEVKEYHKKTGTTVLLVSHSMEDIAKYAERLIVVNDGEIAYDDAPKAVFAHYRELEAMGLAAPQITYIMHALKEKGLDVDVTATTVDEAKENILAVLRKCNLGKLSGNRQSVSDSQSKKENAKAETLISEMEADLTKDGTKESHSDAPDEDLSIQKETMDKKSAEQEENEGGQEV